MPRGFEIVDHLGSVLVRERIECLDLDDDFPERNEIGDETCDHRQI